MPESESLPGTGVIGRELRGSIPGGKFAAIVGIVITACAAPEDSHVPASDIVASAMRQDSRSTRTSALQSEVASLESRRRALADQVATLESRNEELKDRVSSLESKSREIEAGMNALESEKSEQTRQVATVNSRAKDVTLANTSTVRNGGTESNTTTPPARSQPSTPAPPSPNATRPSDAMNSEFARKISKAPAEIRSGRPEIQAWWVTWREYFVDRPGVAEWASQLLQGEFTPSASPAKDGDAGELEKAEMARVYKEFFEGTIPRMTATQVYAFSKVTTAVQREWLKWAPVEVTGKVSTVAREPFGKDIVVTLRTRELFSGVPCTLRPDYSGWAGGIHEGQTVTILGFYSGPNPLVDLQSFPGFESCVPRDPKP